MLFSMVLSPILVIVISLIIKSTSIQFIRPVRSGLKPDPHGTTALKETISLIEMIDSKSVIKIDLNRPQRQQTVIIRNSKSVQIRLYCSIYIPNTVKKSDVLNQLCYQPSISQDEICSSLAALEKDNKIFKFIMNSTSIRNYTGYEITLFGSKSDNDDLSGIYYCKSSTTSAGIVLSNVLEIRDVIYWGKNLIVSQPKALLETYKTDLDVSKIPKSFKCLDEIDSHVAKDIPNWIPFEFKSIVKWEWCPVSKHKSNMMEFEIPYLEDCLNQAVSKCEKPNYLCPFAANMMPGWTEFLSFSGTITLVGDQKYKDFGDRLDGYGLMCYYKSQNNYRSLRFIAKEYGEARFLKGLKWTDIANNRKDIETISPLNQTVRVGMLKNGFSLTALYYCPSNYTFEWRRDGKKMFNAVELTLTKYSLHSSRKVSLQDEGKYYLKVRSGQQEVDFQFNVIVASPPTLFNISIPITFSSVYVMASSNLSISYQYKAQLTNIIVYINGLMYHPGISDHKTFLEDLKKKNAYLKDLNFNVTKKSLKNNIVEVRYNVTNTSFSEALLQSQSHSLIIEARNEYGISRSHLNVNVLRLPIYVNLPVSDNCSISCSSQQQHIFRCEINDKYYADRDIIVEKFWIINGMRLNSLPYYSAFFTDDSKALYMSPVSSNNSDYDKALKSLFKNAHLVCRIRLLSPGSLGLSESDLIREKRIIFDTINDPVFVKQSTAMVKLDWEPTISNASYTWVVFLVIALLLIIMFVFLLVRLTLRDQGGSYQIEKLEIAKGINRDEEIIENETIRPYVRSFRSIGSQVNLLPVVTVHYRLDRPRAPTVCSQCNLFEYGNNSGNGIKLSANKSFLPGYKPQEPLDSIDDENEIEDPSKFNEEGSFIGIYASKDKLSSPTSNEKK